MEENLENVVADVVAESVDIPKSSDIVLEVAQKPSMLLTILKWGIPVVIAAGGYFLWRKIRKSKKKDGEANDKVIEADSEEIDFDNTDDFSMFKDDPEE